MKLEQQLEEKSKRLYVVGNYRFTGKLLGKGNFARVEEAVHNVLEIKVAIKIMEINKIKEEYVIRNLCREAKLMAKLSHPCICALYQTMQRSDNIYYLVTELASGGDLCSFVKEQRGGRLEERSARIYTRQFVSALAHMHSIGVVHRDLKMENVMLNSARTQIKIVDFGLSNLYKPDDPLKTHCGSPEYAAPELFVSGKVYGPEVDVWSLGIILYGMVVGQLPFVTNRAEQITSEERRKRLVLQINKGLSSSHKRSLTMFTIDFRNIIGRMLVPESAKRIAVKEMICHPFITERGSKHIRTSPIKKLDLRHQAEIIAEICELTHYSSDDVIRLVKEEPYSRIGGMFNILSHQMALSWLSGDGVTKILPLKEEIIEKKQSYTVRTDLLTPRVIVQNKTQRPVATAQNSTRPKVDSRWSTGTPIGPLLRPRTVQQTRLNERKNSNYKDLKGLMLTPKTYSVSAGITPKSINDNYKNINQRPSSSVTSPLTKKVSSKMSTAIAIKEVAEKLCLTDRKATEAKKTTFQINGHRNLSKDGKSNGDDSKRVQTVLDKKQRSKSEKLPPQGARQATSTLGALKKHLGTTQSDSRSPRARPQTSIAEGKDYKPISRLPKLSRPFTSTARHQPMEKTTKAYGDIAQKQQDFIQKQKKQQKPMIYDPIARSIAEYVCNNVPSRLTTLSKYKK